MKANEFVKAYGLDEVKYLVSLAANARVCCIDGEHIHVDDLKRIIESHELVEKYKNRHGGIRFRIRWGQFRHGDTQEYIDRLKQAIIDVESCQ